MKKVDYLFRGGRLFFRGVKSMPKGDSLGKKNPDSGFDLEIEMTKIRVGVGELDQKERKRLLNQFIAHGGKVLRGDAANGAAARRAGRTDDGSPRGAARGEILRTYRKADRGTAKADAAAAARAEAPLSPAVPLRVAVTEKPRFTDLLRIQLEGMRRKVFAFGGGRLHERFVRLVRLEMGERLKELHLALGSILRGEVNVINEIRKASTGENSNFYEMLLRLDALYDEKEFGAIQRAVSGRRVPDKFALPLLQRFFKKIYILSEFRSVCKMCTLKAVGIQGRDGGIHSEALLALEDQLSRAVDFILGECCPKFHLLLCKIARRYIPLHTRELDEFLGVSREDVLGYITLMQRKQRMEELRKLRAAAGEPRSAAEGGSAAAGASPASPVVSPHIESGLPLIRDSLERYELLYGSDPSNQIVQLGERDPLYMPLMLLDIFDREYSFILTTGKIFFNIDYREQKRINIKEELGYAYLLLNETWEEAKAYFTAVKEMRENSVDFRLTPYQKYLAEKTLGRKRSMAGKRLMDRIKEVMRAIEHVLDTVIADYNLSGRLMQNPDEVLLFDTNIDGDKVVHGKKVIEAVMEAFHFAATVPFLIESSVNLPNLPPTRD
jgi:hypothetical protein